ncbi:MAG: HEAT repeat domain-containing protein [Bacteroidales bacterium]|nr:HEAT repeat domain-containing protein [Bacteroidales bacterium]
MKTIIKAFLIINIFMLCNVSVSFSQSSEQLTEKTIKEELDTKGLKKFVHDLKQNSLELKTKKIELLGKIGNPEVVELLANNFLKDQSESEQIRSLAAFTLGEIKDQKALKQLIKSLKKDYSPIVRIEAATALGKIGSPIGVNPLIAALKKDENNKVREVSAVALTRIKDPGGVNSLIEILNFYDDNISKIYAIKALGTAKEIRAVKPLNSMVGSRYSMQLDIQIEAVKALVKIKDKTSIQPLQRAFESKQVKLQKEAAIALCKYGVINLRNTVYRSHSKSAKESAKEALISIGDSVVSQLYRFKPLQDYMLSALVEIGSPQAIELLINSLKNLSVPYREKIEASLLLIGKPVIKPLAKVRMDVDNFLLDCNLFSHQQKKISKKLKKEIETLLEKLDYTPSQEEQAAYLIINLKLDEVRKMGKSAVKPAIALLNHKSSITRSNAIKAMREIIDTSFVNPLIQILENDKNFKVRLQAAKTLGEIKDPSAVDPLLYSLKNDENYKVKEEAASALGVIKDNRAIVPLINIANEDSKMFYSAFGALLSINAESPPAIKFYNNALLKMRGYTSQLLKAANIILNSKKPIPAKVREKALSHIANFTTLTEIMNYSKFGKPVSLVLKNTEGKEVAKRRYVYSQKNKSKITSEIIEDLITGKEIHVTKYNQTGQSINQMYLCLDNKGNIIKKAGKAVLTKTIIEENKSSIYTTYNLGYKERSTRSIYPCKKCSSLSKIKNCKYIW